MALAVAPTALLGRTLKLKDGAVVGEVVAFDAASQQHEVRGPPGGARWRRRPARAQRRCAAAV